MDYKTRLKTMEYALQNKKTEMDLLKNQVTKMQQELETTQTRMRAYEVFT